MSKKKTILLYGRTNAGKTGQIGELAEHVFVTTGKRTRLYTIDRGGTDTIAPYIDLGIIDAIERGDTNPWMFLDKATRGFVRDSNGKWVSGTSDDIGLYAFESMRAFAEELKLAMVLDIRAGKSIGGGSNINFTVQSDGETVKVTGGNQTLFGVAQDRVVEAVFESQKLPADYIMWTSSVSKDEDTTASGKVIGPDVIGKALTTESPRWFNRTYRIDVLPAQQGKPERHIIYLGNTVDAQSGGAAGLGNTRRPLDADELKEVTIEPASIVKALAVSDDGKEKATDVIRKRVGTKLDTLKASLAPVGTPTPRSVVTVSKPAPVATVKP